MSYHEAGASHFLAANQNFLIWSLLNECLASFMSAFTSCPHACSFHGPLCLQLHLKNTADDIIAPLTTYNEDGDSTVCVLNVA